MDLLCTICSRIRTYRDLLMIFFHEKRWFHTSIPLHSISEEGEDTDTEEEPRKDLIPQQAPSEGSKPEYEFLIFNYLLRFVHREGQIGDFARAGMLFLIEVAMDIPPHVSLEKDDQNESSEPDVTSALASYILEGDFAEVLSAGLAAVYSLLPSKLLLESRKSPATSGISINTANGALGSSLDDGTYGIKPGRSDTSDFSYKLDHFLIILEFIQDVLKRDKNFKNTPDAQQISLGNSILLAVRKVFLEILLYPSILESSENDGSSVAVMSYLEAIFRTLTHGPMVDFLLKYLLSEGEEADAQSEFSSQKLSAGQLREKRNAKVRRRKSSAMILLEMEVSVTGARSPYSNMGRFTLKDLIKSNMRSENGQVAISALLLLRTLLHSHCEVSSKLLVDASFMKYHTFPLWWTPQSGTEFDVLGSKPTSIEAYLDHEKSVEMYQSLTKREEPLDIATSTCYSHYLDDSVAELLVRRCFNARHSAGLHIHSLRSGDVIIRSVLNSLCQFFTHPSLQNIALCGLLIELALCPHRSLKGWLTAEGSQADRAETGFGIEGPMAQKPRKAVPVVFQIMQDLFAGLNIQRMVIDDFDRLLIERREGLLFSENLQDAMRVPFDREQVQGSSDQLNTSLEGPGTPKRKSKSLLLSFLTPTKKSNTKTRPLTVEPDGGTKSMNTAPNADNPFKDHIEETRGVRIEPPVAELPEEGLWGDRNRWNGIEEDVFGSPAVWEDGHTAKGTEGRGRHGGQREADGRGYELNELLDNVVILEECAKELAAVIEARGCLGIEPFIECTC